MNRLPSGVMSMFRGETVLNVKNRTGSVVGIPKLRLGRVATLTTERPSAPLMKKSSVPSRDQNGRNAPSLETCRFSPVLGNGCIQTSARPVSDDVYPSH